MFCLQLQILSPFLRVQTVLSSQTMPFPACPAAVTREQLQQSPPKHPVSPRICFIFPQCSRVLALSHDLSFTCFDYVTYQHRVPIITTTTFCFPLDQVKNIFLILFCLHCLHLIPQCLWWAVPFIVFISYSTTRIHEQTHCHADDAIHSCWLLRFLRHFFVNL